MPKKNKKKTIVVSTYDSAITLKKFIVQFILVGLIAALTWAVDTGIPSISLEYPQYSVIISLITAIIIAIINYLKHYQDTEEIEVS